MQLEPRGSRTRLGGALQGLRRTSLLGILSQGGWGSVGGTAFPPATTRSPLHPSPRPPRPPAPAACPPSTPPSARASTPAPRPRPRPRLHPHRWHPPPHPRPPPRQPARPAPARPSPPASARAPSRPRRSPAARPPRSRPRHDGPRPPPRPPGDCPPAAPRPEPRPPLRPPLPSPPPAVTTGRASPQRGTVPRPAGSRTPRPAPTRRPHTTAGTCSARPPHPHHAWTCGHAWTWTSSSPRPPAAPWARATRKPTRLRARWPTNTRRRPHARPATAGGWLPSLTARVPRTCRPPPRTRATD